MTNPFDYPAIPEKRREKYFRIINDHQAGISIILMQLFYLDDHMPPQSLDPALNWLIDNRIIGKSFVTWFNGTCCGSPLEMHRLLTKVIENSKEKTLHLIAGKNFKI